MAVFPTIDRGKSHAEHFGELFLANKKLVANALDEF